MQDAFLREAEVLRLFRISASSLRRKVKEGVLPPPVYLGTQVRLWPAAAVDEAAARLLTQTTPGQLHGATAASHAGKPLYRGKTPKPRQARRHTVRLTSIPSDAQVVS